jgi:hypothetical protein
VPGRTPQEAFDAFILPIRKAVTCLGHAKVTTSTDRYNTSRKHVWHLNGNAGMAFAGGVHFEASMDFAYVPHTDGWRVSSRGYRYKLSIGGDQQWRMDWHPNGPSPYVQPHIHMGDGQAHLPTPRFTFEQAAGWVLSSGHVQPAIGEWEAVLDEGHLTHVTHASWSGVAPTFVEPPPTR